MKDALKAAWNHGGSMFATFWIVFALYALGAYLVWAFLQLDAQFSRPLAGDVIPASVTQQIAWGTRAFSVIAGSMAIYFAVKGMKAWRNTFSVLTFIAALILLLHAYGIAAKIMQGQYDADAAIEQVATVNTDAIEQQIADLRQERADVRADTQVTIDTYQRSIQNITTDGLDNDDEAQIYALKQQEALEARDTRLGEIRSEIAALRSENRSVSSTATQAQADSDSFNPLFVFGARLSSGTWNPADSPPDVHKFIWGVAFFTLFFGFGEILMMVAFTGGYAALKVVSERKTAEEEIERQKRSEAAKRAWDTRREKDGANEDGLQIEDKGYWTSRIVKALNRHPNGMKKRTVKGMCDTYFGEIPPSELREHLKRQIDGHLELPKADPEKQKYAIKRGLLSDERKTYLMQEHIDFIFIEGEYAPQEEPKPNGHDHSEMLPTAGNPDNDDTQGGQPVA
jgi:hypothetical protein